jgi:hypothetical protein
MIMNFGDVFNDFVANVPWQVLAFGVIRLAGIPLAIFEEYLY